jgi:uncharacterized damage-inducible protein DinB
LTQELRDIEPHKNIDPELGQLLAMFEDGTHEWRRELTELDLPQEAISWQPYEDFQSIGNIIQHVTEVEATWIHKMAGYREISEEELFRIFDASKDYNEQIYPEAPNESLESYFTKSDEVRKRSIELIHKMGDPKRSSIRVEKNFG